jgi:hypothetical protein
MRHEAIVYVVHFAPVAGPLLLSGCFASPGRVLERGLSRARLGLARLAWVSVLSVAVLGSLMVVCEVRQFQTQLVLELTRNAAFSLGLGLCAAVLLKPVASWLPVACVGMANWVFGTENVTGNPRSWALLCQWAGSAPWMCVAWLVFGAGLALYCLFDGR